MRASSFAAALALLVALLAARAASPAARRLIELGWDEPDQGFLHAHLAQMETAPFDGCVFHVAYRSGGDPARNLTWDVWGRQAFPDSMFAGAIDTLRAVRFRRFTHNFLRMAVTPGDLDWFDDYSSVVANAGLMARIARAAGAKGIFLDVEQYQQHLFDYSQASGAGRRSYAEYAAQARRRGQEVMQAYERGYPGLTVFLSFGWTSPYIRLLGDRIPIEKQPYALLIPFLNGMLDAASDSARIVDGCESAYFLRRVEDVDVYRRYFRDAGSSCSSDSLKYRRIVSMAYGIWLDHDSHHIPWDLKSLKKNYRDPALTRTVLRRMIQDADEYVWVYTEQPRWWSAQGGRVRMPREYVKAVQDARSALRRR
jgi:hypothetical protein